MLLIAKLNIKIFSNFDFMIMKETFVKKIKKIQMIYSWVSSGKNISFQKNKNAKIIFLDNFSYNNNNNKPLYHRKLIINKDFQFQHIHVVLNL